ncbi:hypothetical protein [Phenylobacterium montanum]|uniref:Uncharacterized protein n=1 Tax=Phenylobacterium montanum TaxID=2823693 RepID=A0A975G338_9CAUL|nr:hypothetical protein [Caulobacter sp. S6]QUD89126.1 hypothetical protein KCG34_04360 [Caulobacter sp. S6]
MGSSSSRRLARFLAVVILAATVAAAGTRAAAAQASAESASPREGLAAAKSFALVADLKDQVFGTRAEGIMQKATPLFATDWRSNEEFTGLVARTLEADGKRAEAAPTVENLTAQTERGSPDDEALGKLSSAVSQAHPDMDVDVHLLVLMLPVDRYGREYRPGSYFLGGGLLGLLSHESETFRPAYVVRVNDSMSASDWGRVECTIAYTVVAIDAKSHKVIAKAENQLTHGKLPDRFWIGDYSSLAEEDKSVLHRSCVDGLVSAVTASLRKLGVVRALP